MNSSKRASLSSNSPLDELFAPTRERPAPEREEQHAPPVEEAAPQRAQSSPPPLAPLVEEAPAPPQKAERELHQTTIMIYDDQADWLDEACYLARRDSGSNVSKAAILRALVDMAREDEDIRARLRERLGIGEGG